MRLWRLLLAITWELPQTLLGLFLLLMTHGYGKKTDKMQVANVYWRVCKWGVSLGPIIILGKIYDIQLSDKLKLQTRKHEHGHTRQSLMLGPLYLILVGLPSIFFNILTRMKILKHEDYYTRYPENWADNLSRITR